MSAADQARAFLRATLMAMGLAFLLGAVDVALVMTRLGTPGALLTGIIGALELAALLALGVLGYVTYTTLHDTTLKPLDELSTLARQLESGDLETTGELHGALELKQIGSTLGILANSIVLERRRNTADRSAGARENARLREILDITRHVGSNLEQDLIVAQLATGAQRLGGYSEVVVWRFDELDSDLVPLYPPERLDAGPDKLSRVKAAHTAAGRAASSGQTVQLRAEDGRLEGLAVPLVVGGVGLRILGVLELRGENTSEAMVESPIDALEALASHAATALAAAQLYDQLGQRSETDSLTKLFNRRRLDADLKGEVARSVRYGHPLTLLMIDIDHFKSVNDTFGHQVGDEVLKLVAATLGRGRETDSAYRFGGEEFTVMFRETGTAAARAVAERMRIKIKETVATLGLAQEVTVSVGVAAISDRVRTADKLIQAADTALYTAKAQGRNRVVISNPVARPTRPKANG